MKRGLLALACLVCTVGGAMAQALDTPESLLASCDFASKYNQSWCMSEQVRFVEIYRKSLNKDYYGQRSVASCLVSGCDGAVTIDKRRACAWRMLIVSSGSPYVDTSDRSNYRLDCSGMTTDADRAAVHSMAGDLMMRVYGKPLSVQGNI